MFNYVNILSLICASPVIAFSLELHDTPYFSSDRVAIHNLHGRFPVAFFEQQDGRARIELIPSIPGPYFCGQELTVAVTIAQIGSDSAIRPRFIQLDLSDSSAPFDSSAVMSFDFCGVNSPTYSETQIIGHRLWALSPLVAAPLPGAGLWTVPPIGSLRIGWLRVPIPLIPGSYQLNVLNSNDLADDDGAQIIFGFGGPGDPVTTWRAYSGDLIGEPLTIAAVTCSSDTECAMSNADVCTCGACENGICISTPVGYGNVNCAGPVNLDDILCVLAAFSNFATCPNADLAPRTCPFACEGNHIVNLDDILAVLGAFAGVTPCDCMT